MELVDEGGGLTGGDRLEGSLEKGEGLDAVELAGFDERGDAG